MVRFYSFLYLPFCFVGFVEVGAEDVLGFVCVVMVMGG